MQHVNFYQDQFKPKQIILPAKHILFMALFAIVLFILLSLHLTKRNAMLATYLATQRPDQTIEQQFPSVHDDALLKSKLLSLQQQQSQKQRVLDYLTHQDFGNQQGFTKNLTHLSKQAIPDVWLTSFSFIDGGKHISLYGRATDSSLIPLYIDKLAESGPFQGKHFSVFSLESPESNSTFYTFKLRTEHENAR